MPALKNFTVDRMSLVTPPNSNGWNIPLRSLFRVAFAHRPLFRVAFAHRTPYTKDRRSVRVKEFDFCCIEASVYQEQ